MQAFQKIQSAQTSNSSSKTRGAAAPRTRITWASFLSLEEPLLKLLRSAKLQARILAPFQIVGVQNRPSLFCAI